MASSGHSFFAGIATSVLLLGAGFVGGSMVAQRAMERVPQTQATAADQLPPARVVLPSLTERAAAPAPVTPPAAAAAVPSAAAQQPRAEIIPAKDVQNQPTEKENEAKVPMGAQKPVERAAEQRKAEAAERERRKRYAERRAKRGAARAKQQQEKQQQLQQGVRQPTERAGIMAFDEEQPRPDGFFGN